MEPIKSYGEYKSLIQWNKSRFDKVISNCVLMSSAMERFIEENRLYAQKFENGLAVFVDEYRYYNLYYFWKENAPLADFRKDKPVLVEEMNNRGSKDVFLQSFEPVLHAAGFANFRNNLQVEADFKGTEDLIEQKFAQCVARLEEKKLVIKPCTDQDALQQAFALWQTYLDPTDIPQDHFTLKDGDTVLNITDPTGKVAATIWMRVKGRTSECRHTVTHPDYYQNGLGTAVCYGWLKYSMEQGANRWLTWINEDNFRSWGMYGKIGFRANGKSSKQYILTEGE